MTSFFQILIFEKTKNLSLGFRLGKFRDGGLLDTVYDFIFPNSLILSETNNLSLRFRVGKFPDSGLLDIPLVSISQDLDWSKDSDLSLGFRVGKFRDSGFLDSVYGFIFPNFNF